jgi:thioredoxin-dependent peroxiredoxin
VSLDSASSHRRFREKEGLPFDLLVDPNAKLCRLYDVRVTNLVIAKLVERVTYLIGKDGIIKEAFVKVKPDTHACEVMARV